MFCKNCGSELTDDAKFCVSCGNPTQSSEKSASVETQSNESNKIYYDNKSGIVVDSKVYKQNGSVYPINQISSVEILKNPVITQEAFFLYLLGAAGLLVFLGTGNYLFLLGLLGPVLEYRLFRRVRWLEIRSGGTTERAFKAYGQKDREELSRIKEAITQSISENG